jgi:hypothetical protein
VSNYDYLDVEEDNDQVVGRTYVFGSQYQSITFGKNYASVVRVCLNVGAKHELATDLVSIKPFTDRRLSEGTQEDTCFYRRHGWGHFMAGESRTKTRHLSYTECQLVSDVGNMLWIRSNERE